MHDNPAYPGYRVAIVTLDRHAAGPAMRALPALRKDFEGLCVSIHAAAEWADNPQALEQTKQAIRHADIIVCCLLFLEEHISAILPELRARRDACDAMLGLVSDRQIVNLTKAGELDMGKPSSMAIRLLKRLRPKNTMANSAKRAGESQMQMLRRLPRILRFIPGKAQDLRAYFLAMQYWLGGSDDNIREMLRYLVGRYSNREDWRTIKAADPITYPEVGLYHPDLPGHHITETVADLPTQTGPRIGVLMLRSYILASDTAHYDAVIRAFEAKGMQVIPAFSGGLDGRPAMARFFEEVDAIVSLTGFSLVGGPAYNDADAAVETLKAHNVPYVAAHPLEFQTLEAWEASSAGLGPVETTMLIALPEIDGATNPTVFAGRHHGKESDGDARAMAPCEERVHTLSEKVWRLATLRRMENRDKRVGVVLFGFPPNAGAVGTAAYLSVFESLFNTLHRMKREGYTVEVPDSVEALRERVVGGNAKHLGQEANVAARVSADDMVRDTPPYLHEIEAVWGPAPGNKQSDGRSVFILGGQFGNVFVGLQPVFGYEGDPMRLLFEKGFAPTHAFTQFYLWLRNTFAADVLLHFGMHGALEFMPGKQAGLGERDWPDRLIGQVPNVYLYASNNPSEATLAKRRTNAVTVTHITSPVATSGLYKGLADLKDTLNRWRETEPGDERDELARLISEQAEAADLDGGAPEDLWIKLLETQDALIPDGLHILGQAPSKEARQEHLRHLADQSGETLAHVDAALQADDEMTGLMAALSGHYIPPVPGGDFIRAPEILPAGRNIHAFDPYRMPTAYALREGQKQADLLLKTQATLPRTIALVLWGSDNIKSNGGPISQALALLGAKPRFDNFGRLCGAELIPLEELGRPRIDVVMTLSGIFRDLLPLQTRLLADAAYLCAVADEPEQQNYIRAHALAYAQKQGTSLEEAALRVFSNAQGAYGSNVNMLVDQSGFEHEDDLADAYEARKSFAYGRNGNPSHKAALLQETLRTVDVAYQNLESVELGITTVDHYFDTLGGIARSVKRAKGGEAAEVYIGDQTRGTAKVRTLKDQIALETRSRSLNPKWFEGMLKHGPEGVRHIETQFTNTLGWSATTGQVDPWVYQRLSETFVLDEDLRARIAELNPQAGVRMANRLLEASDRAYWTPDAETLAALQGAADDLEDQLEGVAAQ